MSGFNPDSINILYNDRLEPAWNLALEEYLLKNRQENFLVLWQNRKAIITGKHQVTYKEVNYPFCIENDIPVHRRLSGGGTVYHDDGNLNFTIIENRPDKNRLIDFKRYLTPMSAFLNQLGIPAVLSDRNDLLVNGYKISGNAQHIEQKLQRVIHHGTLLVAADLKALGEGLHPSGVKYESKAVDSVRSKVINLNDLQGVHLKMGSMIHELRQYFREHHNGQDWSPDEEDIKVVDHLSEGKYSTWDWNFGYSPKYTASIRSVEMELVLEVKNGKIINAVAESQSGKRVVQSLIGLNHSQRDMQQFLASFDEAGILDWKQMF